MNYIEVISLIKTGKTFEVTQYPDLGTSSMTRPIKNTGKYISKFKIDGIEIHHKSGQKVLSMLNSSVLANDFIIERSIERSGLCYVKTFRIEPK